MNVILVTGPIYSYRKEVVQLLSNTLGKDNVNVISLKDHRFPKSNFDPGKKIDWKSPRLINWESINQVIVDLLVHKKSTYKVFNEKTLELDKTINIDKREFLIIEGMYSSKNTDVKDAAFIHFFTHSSQPVRFERWLSENKDIKWEDEDELKKIRRRWKRKEDKHFRKYVKGKKRRSDYIINTDDFLNQKDSISKEMIEEIEAKLDKIKGVKR